MSAPAEPSGGGGDALHYFRQINRNFARWRGGVVLISTFVELQGLGLKLGVDFTFAWDNHNENHKNHNNNPNLNFLERNSTRG